MQVIRVTCTTDKWIRQFDADMNEMKAKPTDAVAKALFEQFATSAAYYTYSVFKCETNVHKPSTKSNKRKRGGTTAKPASTTRCVLFALNVQNEDINEVKNNTVGTYVSHFRSLILQQKWLGNMGTVVQNKKTFGYTDNIDQEDIKKSMSIEVLPMEEALLCMLQDGWKIPA